MDTAPEFNYERFLGRGQWLLRLRWVAVGGQLLTVFVVAGVWGVRLPLLALGSVVAVTAVSNTIFASWLRSSAATRVDRTTGSGILAGLMALDLCALTALLVLTGGTRNPFTVFYFVNLALAAVLLRPRWVWMLSGLATLGLVIIAVWHLPLPELEQPLWRQRDPSQTALRVRDAGMVIALVTCSVVVVYFMTRIMHELRELDRKLRIAEQRQQRSRQLESLGTLAAGAAHELATPLSTIALVANELARQLEGRTLPEIVFEDIQLVRGEVEHCRAILNRMSGRAGQTVGEEMTTLSVAELMDCVLSEIRQPERIHLRLPYRDEDKLLVVPLQTVAQAVRGVIQNGLDASQDGQKIEVAVHCDDHVHLQIRDHGRGMPQDELARAGEPFFTTKPPGSGMGLGLFLTRSVFERLGGDFSIQSTPHQGTRVELRLPLRS